MRKTRPNSIRLSQVSSEPPNGDLNLAAQLSEGAGRASLKNHSIYSNGKGSTNLGASQFQDTKKQINYEKLLEIDNGLLIEANIPEERKLSKSYSMNLTNIRIERTQKFQRWKVNGLSRPKMRQIK